MAYDVIYGQTSRDWSCGGVAPVTPSTADLKLALTPAKASSLAETVRKEIGQNAKLVLQLMKAKRLPEAERLAFSKFFKKWTDFYSAHRGKFGPRDQLALWNLRGVNQQFAARLAVFETVANTPIRPPAAAPTSTALVPFRPAGSVPPTASRVWPIVIGAGLGLAALLTMKNHRLLAS